MQGYLKPGLARSSRLLLLSVAEAVVNSYFLDRNLNTHQVNSAPIPMPMRMATRNVTTTLIMIDVVFIPTADDSPANSNNYCKYTKHIELAMGLAIVSAWHSYLLKNLAMTLINW